MIKKKVRRRRPTSGEFRRRCTCMYNDIKRKILTNEWPRGDYLPSEKDVGNLYGISRMSARRIMGQLQEQGLVTRIKGKGTVVGKPINNELKDETVAILLPKKNLSSQLPRIGGREKTEILETPGFRITIMMDTLETELLQRGIPLQMMELDDLKQHPHTELVKQLVDRKVRGLVVIYEVSPEVVAFSQAAVRAGIGIVLLGSREVALPGVSSVSYHNNYQVGEMAVRHLIKLGHRKIACLAGDEPLDWIEKRVKAYRNTYAEAGLCCGQSLLVRTPRVADENQVFQQWVQVGRKAGRQLLEQNEATAVFCINDAVACGLFDAAKQAGVAIPRDLSVIGCDNDYNCFHLNLTTLKLECSLAAEVAADMIVRFLTGENNAVWPIDLKVAPRLIAKGSTRPLRPSSLQGTPLPVTE